MAAQAGADCLAVACPMCQVNLDLRQADIHKAYGDIPQIPALYVTQLLGLALGLAPDALGLDALSISPASALRQCEYVSGGGGGAMS